MRSAGVAVGTEALGPAAGTERDGAGGLLSVHFSHTDLGDQKTIP